jgi:hypothetical protein
MFIVHNDWDMLRDTVLGYEDWTDVGLMHQIFVNVYQGSSGVKYGSRTSFFRYYAMENAMNSPYPPIYRIRVTRK